MSSLLDAVNKKYGNGSMMKLGEAPKQDIEIIPSGSLALDLALGIGGFPKGRIIELMGWESSGKTTISIHTIAEAQKLGMKAAFIDAEHAFDKNYAEALGVDIDELYFSQPDSGEEALDIAEMVVRSGEIDICVIDSVAALTPKAEIEGEMGDSKMGLHARLMSQALRKLTAPAKQNNCMLIFINQLREKIGVMFGNPQTTTGGNALKFYASVRAEVSKKPVKDKNGDILSNDIKVKIIKNKVAPPFKIAEFEIKYGEGINKYKELIDIAVELEIFQKSGAWYSYQEEKIGQGRDQVIQLLKDNPELYQIVEEKVFSQINEI